MCKSLYVLEAACLLIALPLVSCDTCSCPLAVPKDNCEIVQNIFNFQKGGGVPSNILELISSSKSNYEAVYVSKQNPTMSYDHIYLSATLDTLTLTFIVKHCDEIYSVTYNVSESNGVITSTDGVSFYIVYSGNSVLGIYMADEEGQTVGPPAAFIFTDPKVEYDTCTKENIIGGVGAAELILGGVKMVKVCS